MKHARRNLGLTLMAALVVLGASQPIMVGEGEVGADAALARYSKPTCIAGLKVRTTGSKLWVDRICDATLLASL